MRRGVIVLAAVLVVFALAQGSMMAKTLEVPGEYPDLKVALDEATYGDTVLVSPGRYRLQTTLRSGVTLTSTDGPDSTVLWNQRWHILLLMDCDIATVVSGFTFAGKGSNVCIACTTGAPVIEGNVFQESWDGLNLFKCNAMIKGNKITGCNRGVHIEYADPEFVGNELTRNGDGISMISSAPVIARCKFEHNGRAILILGHSYPTIGGSLDMANDILTNGYPIYNQGLRIDGTQFTDRKEVAIATHNYWGSDCPEERRFRGDVMIKPWTDAEHRALIEECPEPPVPESDQ
jgi:hypothetical protein